MTTLYNYLKTPSYKFIVRSLIELFQEDYEKIVRQFIVYGINNVSEVERIMPQDDTPGFPSHPNKEVYVFTIDLQTPITSAVIYETICEVLNHSFASIIVHGYYEPVETAYRGKCIVAKMDREASNEQLVPASIFTYNQEDTDRYSSDFIQAMAGQAGIDAAVSGAYQDGQKYVPITFMKDNPLMKDAVKAQSEIQVELPASASKDYEFVQKYRPPYKPDDWFDTTRWYRDAEGNLTKKVTKGY